MTGESEDEIGRSYDVIGEDIGIVFDGVELRAVTTVRGVGAYSCTVVHAVA